MTEFPKTRADQGGTYTTARLSDLRPPSPPDPEWESCPSQIQCDKCARHTACCEACQYPLRRQAGYNGRLVHGRFLAGSEVCPEGLPVIRATVCRTVYHPGALPSSLP